jgi:hypothetical protein
VTIPRLTAQQQLDWPGRLPADATGLPALMERLHFATVDRHSGGLVRTRTTSSGVALALLGRWSIMGFDLIGDEVAPGRAIRRYNLPPGPATRRVPVPGIFELGVEERGDQVHSWLRVEDFPSVMLSLPPPAPTIYPAFHAHVSNRYLRALRTALAG